MLNFIKEKYSSLKRNIYKHYLLMVHTFFHRFSSLHYSPSHSPFLSILLDIVFYHLSLFRYSHIKNMHVFCTHDYSFYTYLSYILPCIWLQFLFVDVDYHKFFYNQDLGGGGAKYEATLFNDRILLLINVAVIRLKYCRYGIKHYQINKSKPTARH